MKGRHLLTLMSMSLILILFVFGALGAILGSGRFLSMILPVLRCMRALRVLLP